MADFHEQYRLQQVRDALELLKDLGQVWFQPANEGDLGALWVDDIYVAAIRNYSEDPD